MHGTCNCNANKLGVHETHIPILHKYIMAHYIKLDSWFWEWQNERMWHNGGITLMMMMLMIAKRPREDEIDVIVVVDHLMVALL